LVNVGNRPILLKNPEVDCQANPRGSKFRKEYEGGMPSRALQRLQVELGVLGAGPPAGSYEPRLKRLRFLAAAQTESFSTE
jgi:hypothetical protein